jgi:energy-coupling factor transporter ATPase
VSIVEIRNLSYSYPGLNKPALINIDLTIEKGDFIILTGPSGCGKTTLCRCLNGLIPHFYNGDLTGDVIVTGLSVKDNPTSKIAQHVGFVFQNPENQLFALSVEKDIAFGLENLAVPRNEIRKHVDHALDLIGITNLRDSAPYELSGGQKQRVAIACILAMHPELMILDEPTSFLDPVAAKNLFEIIYALNKELGLTIILVEHRLDLLCTYANRVIIMDEGKVKADGIPRDILSSKEVLSLGIGIPKITKLYLELKASGIHLGDPPISVNEIAQEIRTLMLND